MAKTRVVNTRFWDDDYITDLDPIEKLLFLYFLTNPLTDLCGAYEVSLKRIAFDTGLKPPQIKKILAKLEAGGKMMYRSGWILIRNFGKHQQGNSPNVRKGAERSLSACPDWIKQTLSKGWGSVGIENAPIPIPIGITYRDNSVEAAVETASPPRASRIPDPFLLTSEMKEWAAGRAPSIDLLIETEKFVNYWRAKSGRDATKLDWFATWRNWILNTRTNGTSKSNHNSKSTPAELIANRPYRDSA